MSHGMYPVQKGHIEAIFRDTRETLYLEWISGWV